jgi:phosphatidylglycerophosphate synthase
MTRRKNEHRSHARVVRGSNARLGHARYGAMSAAREVDVDRALVLAMPVDGASPLDGVAGLPLVLRTVLTLQRAGIRRIELAIGANDEQTADKVRADRRVRVELDVRVAASTRAAIADTRFDAPFLVAAHHAIASPSVYAALMGHRHDAGAVLPADGDLPMLATSRTLETVRARPDSSWERLSKEWRESEGAQVLEPVGWIADARTVEGRRRAVFELFEACRKPVDGIVSRHLNRHVSIFLSKLLVDTRVSPNAISGVCFALGVMAAVVVSRPTYATMVAGAALLQFNSILDGVDGELARVRFQGSKLGEWIDTVSDDVSNALFYAGTAWASLALPPPAPTLALLGFGAVAFSLVTMVFYYAELARLGRGDFYALDTGKDDPRTGLWATIQTGARYVLKKDFFVLSFLVAALLGILPWVQPIVFAGTIATAVTGIRMWLRRPR